MITKINFALALLSVLFGMTQYTLEFEPRWLKVQGVHYMSRVHDLSTKSPPLVNCSHFRSCWSKDKIKEQVWNYKLSNKEKNLVRSIGMRLSTHVKTIHYERAYLRFLNQTQKRFMKHMIKTIQHKLNPVTGIGFIRIQGVPVDSMPTAGIHAFYIALSRLLGKLGQQNQHGDWLGHVINQDTTNNRTNTTTKPRLYRTNQSIAFHTDWADIVGLLVLATSAQGGESCVTSSMKVYDTLRQVDPSMVEPWFASTFIDLRSASKGKLVPVTMGAVDTMTYPGQALLRTMYHGDYLRNNRTSPEHADMYDHIDQVANEQALCMNLDVGDIQFLSNHFILHSRKAYQDEAPDKIRHLLRIWISQKAAYGELKLWNMMKTATNMFLASTF
jgi:hypothetical protein